MGGMRECGGEGEGKKGGGGQWGEVEVMAGNFLWSICSTWPREGFH